MYDILVEKLKGVLPADVPADTAALILLVLVFAILVGAIVIIIWQLVKLYRVQTPPRRVITEPSPIPVGGTPPENGGKKKQEIISEDPLPPMEPWKDDKIPPLPGGGNTGTPGSSSVPGATVLDGSEDDEKYRPPGTGVYMNPEELPVLELWIPLPTGRVNCYYLQPEVLKELPGQVVLIGRSQEAQLQFRDKSVSKRHLHLGADTRGYWVEDVGSSNGTLLNGSVCTAHQRYHLKSGDSLRLGNSELQIRLGVPHEGLT